MGSENEFSAAPYEPYLAKENRGKKNGRSKSLGVRSARKEGLHVPPKPVSLNVCVALTTQKCDWLLTLVYMQAKTLFKYRRAPLFKVVFF